MKVETPRTLELRGHSIDRLSGVHHMVKAVLKILLNG
jgi:hypothetical protein